MERVDLVPTDANGLPGVGTPPAPGDLFVLAATADLPVEWAILDRRPGQLLAVPADTRSFAGGADVEVPAELSGGPLSLRCRFGVWLDASLFEPALRSGSLTPDIVAEALHHFRRVESGDLDDSPLAEEVDADPEYVDWLREVPERARDLAVAARPALARPSPALSWTSAHRLAAVFALLAVGLSVWVTLLRREVGRLSAPIFDIPVNEVALGTTDRGGTVLEIPRGASHVLLLLVVNTAIAPREGRFEIVDAGGRTVWRGTRVHLSPAGEFRLVVPRGLLPDGRYSVRIVPDAGGPPIAEKTLRITTGE
jgi:hypothetical protein